MMSDLVFERPMKFQESLTSTKSVCLRVVERFLSQGLAQCDCQVLIGYLGDDAQYGSAEVHRQ